MNLATATPTHIFSCDQPWATGLVHAVEADNRPPGRPSHVMQTTWKAAEFRCWSLWERFVGQPLALHATIREPYNERFWLNQVGLSEFPHGAIVGVVWFGPPIKFSAFCDDYIFAAHEDSEDNPDAWILVEPGCPYDNDNVKQDAEWVYAWPVVKAVELLAPIPFKKNQGITLLPDAIRAQLADALA